MQGRERTSRLKILSRYNLITDEGNENNPNILNQKDEKGYKLLSIQ